MLRNAHQPGDLDRVEWAGGEIGAAALCGRADGLLERVAGATRFVCVAGCAGAEHADGVYEFGGVV